MSDSKITQDTQADENNQQQSLADALPPLIQALQLPDTFTEIDQLQQQNLPIPPNIQHQQKHYTNTTTTTLLTLVTLLSNTQLSHASTGTTAPRLPSSLLVELLLSLITHSISVPTSFRRRYPSSVLSYITPQWLTASNRSLATQAQRLLHGASEDDGDDEAVLALLYERHAAALVKRVRARMRGKGDEWKGDVSTAYIFFHLIAHLSNSAPNTANIVLSQLHELVPCVLPLLHSHEQRHRVVGCLVLSHLLLVLPAYSFPSFTPLLLHTFAPLLSDRDTDTQRIVLPTFVDLLLSSTPAFPLTASSADEAQRTTLRLSARPTHILPELQYLSLSASASVDVIAVYLEQLIRVVVWLHSDVLPHVTPLLTLLFRLGCSFDARVRRRAWVCVGVVMEVGGERMGWHRGKVEEQLRLCEVECERHVELNERVSEWHDKGSGLGDESAVAREARERTEGWKDTRRLVVDMRERLIKRWPRKEAAKKDHAAASAPSSVVAVS